MIVRVHVFFLEIKCVHATLCVSARLSLEMGSLFEGLGGSCGPVECKNGMVGWLVDGKFVGGGYELSFKIEWTGCCSDGHMAESFLISFFFYQATPATRAVVDDKFQNLFIRLQ